MSWLAEYHVHLWVKQIEEDLDTGRWDALLATLLSIAPLDYQLPLSAQALADKNYELLQSDPSHASLHFKRIGSRRQLWSVRVGEYYRALGTDCRRYDLDQNGPASYNVAAVSGWNNSGLLRHFDC